MTVGLNNRADAPGLAPDGAKVQAASAEASISSLEAHMTFQEANIRQARAAVDADDAAIRLAKTNQGRQG
jgi:membrane fusion protein (multidrug efflux system)